MKAAFKRGMYILYKSLNGDMSPYIVDAVSVDSNGLIQYHVKSVSSDGSQNSKYKKAFTTTLKDANGRVRLFPIWLQPGDQVKLLNEYIDKKGEVMSIMSSDKKGGFDIMIEVVTANRKMHLFTLDNATNDIELL